jgi:hypothetical protein
MVATTKSPYISLWYSYLLAYDIVYRNRMVSHEYGLLSMVFDGCVEEVHILNNWLEQYHNIPKTEHLILKIV